MPKDKHWEEGKAIFFKKIGSKKGIRLMVIGMIVTILLIAAVCINYISKLQSAMDSQTQQYLSELAEHASAMMEERIEHIGQSLDSTASRLNHFSSYDGSDVRAFLLEEAERYKFLRITVSKETGEAFTSDGQYIDLSSQPFFQAAMNGKFAISSYDSMVNGDGVITSAVPIWRDGKVSGVVSASISQERMQELLNVTSFAGDGYSMVIDSRGSFVLNCDAAHVKTTDNFFDMVHSGHYVLDSGQSVEQMQNDMTQRKAGTVCMLSEGKSREIVSYRAIGVSDWYLLSAVPSDVTNQEMEIFLQYTIQISALMLLLFILLAAVTLLLQRRARQALEEMAYFDPVTKGISPVRFQMLAVKKLLEKAPAYYSLVIWDLDKFKLINDTFGRESGDAALRYILHCIQKDLKATELAARLTSDKFVLLLETAPPEKMAERLARIAAQINQFNRDLEQKYYLTFTVGIYTVTEPGLDLITMQDRANSARKSGTNRYSAQFCNCMLYSEQELGQLRWEKEIENEMELALKHHDFAVYFQPKYSLSTGKIAGAEALVRWVHPTKGVIPPIKFIPVFERNSFVIRVDLYVFEEVCKWMKRWKEAGFELFPVSVNMSRAHLSNPEFLEAYRRIFNRYTLPADLIEIELTETLIYEDMERMLQVIGQIHEQGFTCSLDDFGSGYSSLNLLKDVPVDVLKLDRAFFSGAREQGDRANSVVESVLLLAQKLQMRTVAEGVEDDDEVGFLRAAGCDMVQGYVFSKPLPAEEFERLAFDAEVLMDS